MSHLLSEYLQKRARADRAHQEAPRLSREERRALSTLRKEARLVGSKLANNGKGGLSPSLVLTVMRRDGYVCKVHGDQGEGENGGLTLHHKGGVVESEWLSKKGHKNVPNNLVVICSRAHDEIHSKARNEGVDSSQITPKGDEEKE